MPVFGICYGHQVMVRELGGTVERTGAAEYGGTPLHVQPDGGRLLGGLGSELSVWMSHGDTSTVAPPGFTVTARRPRQPRPRRWRTRSAVSTACSSTPR